MVHAEQVNKRTYIKTKYVALVYEFLFTDLFTNPYFHVNKLKRQSSNFVQDNSKMTINFIH